MQRLPAHLGVLVGLGAVEVAAVDHGGMTPVQAGRQAAQVAQVSLGRHVAGQRVGVACTASSDGACI